MRKSGHSAFAILLCGKYSHTLHPQMTSYFKPKGLEKKEVGSFWSLFAICVQYRIVKEMGEFVVKESA
jgi:hypothetical protein